MGFFKKNQGFLYFHNFITSPAYKQRKSNYGKNGNINHNKPFIFAELSSALMQFYAILASLFDSLPLFAIHLAINVPKIAMIIAAIAELSMYSIIIPFIYVFSIKHNY
ncbi:hypothetical protein [Campylobacter sp.]|uniref:hypothetical protein n=1 Tax=Campylobacter sp. TaxID=205 RepID=UPI002AA75269|nr:hypothetical protein [Campylobacter sp.]